MNTMEVFQLLVEEYESEIRRAKEQGLKDEHTAGYIMGLRSAVLIVNNYMEEKMEEMAKDEEVYMEAAGDDAE